MPYKYFLILLAFLTLSLTGCMDDPVVYSSDDIHTSSFFYSIGRNDWSNTNESGHWYTRLRASAITYSVIDYGSVLVYYRNAENNWVLLPYSTTWYDNDGFPYAEEIWFGFALGTIDVDYIYSNPLDPTPRELYLKVVVCDYR